MTTWPHDQLTKALRVALLALVLLGVAQGSARAIELSLWTTDDQPERLATMRYVAEVFMALHDGVELRIEGVDENDLVARFEATPSGERPTLVNTGGVQLLALGADGLLDPSAATEGIEMVGVERFHRGALGMLETGTAGSWYALPLHGWIQGVWYRTDWFAEAGLDAPTDVERMLTAAAALHDPEAGRYGILIGTAGGVYTTQVFSQIALAGGARLLDPDGTPEVASPAMLEALEAYRRLAAYLPPGAEDWRGRDYFLQGRLAMMVYSTFIMDDLALPAAAAASLTGDNFEALDGAGFDPDLLGRVAMVPVLGGRRPTTFGSINGIAIRQGLDAPTRAAALALIRFLYRPDVYVTWLHMAPGGMMPVLRDIAASERFLRDPSGVFRRYGRKRLAAITAAFDRIRTFGRPDGRFVPAASRALAAGVVGRMVRAVTSGASTPLAAARQAETELRQLSDGD